MGRGRQKAKQAKVARRLKYETHEPDLAALQRELSGKGNPEETYEEYDPYAQYIDDDETQEPEDIYNPSSHNW